MSSQRSIDSSRANGAKSRGPVTPEGRARSAAAGLTHGLTSNRIVLEQESEEEFNALREEYLAEYRPQTRSRFDLVDQLVAARWRLNRVLALQTALIDRQITRQEPKIREEYKFCDGDTRAAIAYQHLTDEGGALESLNRHETRLSAELRRTLKLLDAPPRNQKFHHEPSDAQPLQFDEDGAAAEAPPSAIDHLPSTSPDDPAAEAPAAGHRPSTIDQLRRSRRRSPAIGHRPSTSSNLASTSANTPPPRLPVRTIPAAKPREAHRPDRRATSQPPLHAGRLVLPTPVQRSHLTVEGQGFAARNSLRAARLHRVRPRASRTGNVPRGCGPKLAEVGHIGEGN